ncbi:MAG: hypothetical protein QXF12_00030 [Candidatus Aenigmatarchaeota archaeon]
MRYDENMNEDFKQQYEELNKLLEHLFFHEFKSEEMNRLELKEHKEIDVLPIVPPEDDIEDGYFYY